MIKTFFKYIFHDTFANCTIWNATLKLVLFYPIKWPKVSIGKLIVQHGNRFGVLVLGHLHDQVVDFC